MKRNTKQSNNFVNTQMQRLPCTHKQNPKHRRNKTNKKTRKKIGKNAHTHIHTTIDTKIQTENY